MSKLLLGGVKRRSTPSPLVREGGRTQCSGVKGKTPTSEICVSPVIRPRTFARVHPLPQEEKVCLRFTRDYRNGAVT
jgi:hypothetical protein